MLSIEYMAGFIDGEGCITLSYKNAKSLTPVVLIVNTNYEIMLNIKLTLDSWNVCSYVNYDNTRGNRKVAYKLSVQKIDDVYTMLSRLYPSLKVKQKQAAIVLEYIDRRRREPFRLSNDFYRYAEEAVSKIRDLNHRGL